MNATLFIALSLFSSVVLATPRFNVKTGLWEITRKMETTGMPALPPEMLAKLPPEQRAKMEAAIKQSMDGKERITKHCISEKELDKPFEDTNMNQHCTKQYSKQTSSVLDFKMECNSDKMSSTGTFHLEAQSKEHVTAKMDMTVENAGQQMKVKSTMSGKWLRSHCGDIQPGRSD